MLSTLQAFEKFRKSLELSPTEQKDAEKRHIEARNCIRAGFDVTTDFLSGSYKRHTKTKPLKDVDVVFVLGDREKWRRDKPPIEMLKAFESHLKKTYTGKDQVDLGRRSVAIEFEKNWYPEDHEGKVMSVDAVPAFGCGDDFEIPDKITGTWIKTNPTKHRDQSTAKNKALDGRWVPLVKMLKGWNRANGRPVKPSFLVEVMAEGLVDAPFSSYPQEVRNFFAAAEANIDRTWPDPAGLGPPVSDQMTPALAAEARKALQDAQRKVALASRAEETGRQGDALRIWREVLGDYFPLSQVRIR
jgi:Second Messenger Oligonucleotide or Dinucleotide Synthetase domain